MSTLSDIQSLKDRMHRSIVGQEHLIERLIITLLADGNMLLEGLPGLAKTRAIKSLARELEAGLSRIQFTPDLLPSDITGTEIYLPEAENPFEFQPGPIFSNLILADEINRAPAKVQSALLEAMEERQVSVAGKTYPMAPLFMVLATQNPVEQEGTYPLPEAQMDRFLMHVTIDYPSDEEELAILRMVRGEASQNGTEAAPVIPQDVLFAARKEILSVHVSESMERYMVDLVAATRRPAELNDDLGSWIDFGASPRGTLALDKASRAHAWLAGQDFVSPEDIRAIFHDVLRHRLIMSYEAQAAGVNADRALDDVLKLVAVNG
ncbi:MoxR family ATPase [Pontibacter sp. G13]|uniref:AAA family ATPase n=1 Tax=Pontibacter sp. G13 TaxID=3074898 RepID=UPI00288A1328|nr:MoxR family ATPase [Pontibacter sp. G13]WNJ17359.1 MoxR family ATPase [Pontibacter sp. G13]